MPKSKPRRRPEPPTKDVDVTPDLKPGVKTTIVLPIYLWKQAKVRAIEDRVDLRNVVIASLEAYLRKGER